MKTFAVSSPMPSSHSWLTIIALLGLTLFAMLGVAMLGVAMPGMVGLAPAAHARTTGPESAQPELTNPHPESEGRPYADLPSVGPLAGLHPGSGFARQEADTVWFGGHDQAGYAYEGGIWDFEGDGGAGDLQGWTTVDVTANPDDYFRRVTAADFATDPCVPLFPAPSAAQIWCGIHEEEANSRDFVAGIGYMNDMCQSAFSPSLPAGDVQVSFIYFNDTELDWDYTYVYVRCLNGTGELLDDGLIELDRLTGIVGSPESPETFSGDLDAGDFPFGTEYVQLELRMDADGAWSDEDGLYDSVCGPFAADDITFSAGDQTHFADFEDGEDGYSFSRCPGMGTYMGLVSEDIYTQWLDFVGLACSCTLTGWALEFVDEENSQYTIPGHLAGQHEMGISPIVDRGDYTGAGYNTCVVEWDNYLYLQNQWGGHFRQGYMIYPYTTEVNPEPHWSGRLGQDDHLYTIGPPACYRRLSNLTTLDGRGGTPMPNSWEQMRFTYEVYCSCDAFGVPSTICVEEGNTKGSPVIDNIQVGLTESVDAPAISVDNGLWWHDGFGQNFPTYLEPSDVGNANVARDLSPTNVDPDPQNDWHADTAIVTGPLVDAEEGRWLCDLCFRVEPGPRQHLIPEYMAWKARLGGDPEADFVCVLMDSLETPQGVASNKFASYFHEDDPGFDPAFDDLAEEQEIFPDLMWTPGTTVNYFYRAYWYAGGAPPEAYFTYPAYIAEFEILPGMHPASAGDSPGQDAYEVQWPCVLYIDAINAGVEYYVNPMLEQLGLEYDKYDYLISGSNYHTPFARSFGGTKYNPGGYGNNGATAEQVLGYRLILLNTGVMGVGGLENKDWPLFEAWLTTTACGLSEVRRGLIFDGDEIARIVDSYTPMGRDFLNNTLGVDLIWESYRDYATDWEFCVFLEPDANALFVAEHDLSLYGNGCPNTYNFNVLGMQAGVPGVSGNYLFSGAEDVEFAQVIRDHSSAGRNLLSAVDGFSVHHLSWPDSPTGGGETGCPSDSASVLEGASSMIGAMLDWMTDPEQPWDAWRYPCTSGDVAEDEDPTHLAGPVNHLFASRPNPFHRSAMIRYHTASEGVVRISVVDVSGRLVRTLIDAVVEPGEHTVAWDGLTGDGGRVPGGIYWVSMTTQDGYASGKKMLLLR